MPANISNPFGWVVQGAGSSPAWDLCDFPQSLVTSLLSQPYLTRSFSLAGLQAGADAILFTPQAEVGQVRIDQPVGVRYTLELQFQLGAQAPLNLGMQSSAYFFLAIVDHSGPTLGLYFTRSGLVYTSALGGASMPLTRSALVPGHSYVLRIAADHQTRNLFLYLDDAASDTRTLLHILPTLPHSSFQSGLPEGVHFLAKGSGDFFHLEAFRFASLPFVSNYPPTAAAKDDQTVVNGAIVQLDGEGSTDTEGAQLTYGWRLVDAPAESMYSLTGLDGDSSYVVTPGYPQTDRFYAPSLLGSGVAPGSVLLLDGVAYPVKKLHEVGSTAYLELEAADLPIGGSDIPYKVISQSGFFVQVGRQVSFYPDHVGFYKFDLHVFDGALVSSPTTTVVNVAESTVPKGILPKADFVWDYLSNFWGLVEERDRIEVLWSSALEVLGNELLHAWQVDYSKSLRDVQQTLQRKWLHFDLVVHETFTDFGALAFAYSPLDSAPLPAMDNHSGTYLDLWLLGVSKRVLFPAGTRTPADVTQVLRRTLESTGVAVHLVEGQTDTFVRLVAPFPLTVGASTNVYFAPEACNGYFTGASAQALTDRVLRLDQSLVGYDLRNFPLRVGEYAFTILQVISNTDDPLPFMRVVVKEAISLEVTGAWEIPVWLRTQEIDLWQALAHPGDFLVVEVTSEAQPEPVYYPFEVRMLLEEQPKLVGANPGDLLMQLQSPAMYQFRVVALVRRTAIPISDQIVDIPTLQRTIRSSDSSELLKRNLDFFLTTVRGKTAIVINPYVWEPSDRTNPPKRLWAEFVYVDNRPAIEGNFGLAVGYTLALHEQTELKSDYLAAVRGLWYAFLNGPTVYNVQVATQIMLGLPFVEEPGTVLEFRDDFSPSRGRVLIQGESQGLVRSYHYPVGLDPADNPLTGAPIQVGDYVPLFTPLVSGVEVVDYVTSPDWFQTFLGQGFFQEVSKFFTFMVRLDSKVTSAASYAAVRRAIEQMRPKYTKMYLIYRQEVGPDEIEVTDELAIKARLSLFDVIYPYARGVGGILDDPRSGGTTNQIDVTGGNRIRTHYDVDLDPDTPEGASPVREDAAWPFDIERLAPISEVYPIIHFEVGPSGQLPADVVPILQRTGHFYAENDVWYGDVDHPHVITDVYLGVVGVAPALAYLPLNGQQLVVEVRGSTPPFNTVTRSIDLTPFSDVQQLVVAINDASSGFGQINVSASVLPSGQLALHLNTPSGTLHVGRAHNNETVLKALFGASVDFCSNVVYSPTLAEQRGWMPLFENNVDVTQVAVDTGLRAPSLLWIQSSPLASPYAGAARWEDWGSTMPQRGEGPVQLTLPTAISPPPFAALRRQNPISWVAGMTTVPGQYKAIWEKEVRSPPPPPPPVTSAQYSWPGPLTYAGLGTSTDVSTLTDVRVGFVARKPISPMYFFPAGSTLALQASVPGYRWNFTIPLPSGWVVPATMVTYLTDWFANNQMPLPSPRAYPVQALVVDGHLALYSPEAGFWLALQLSANGQPDYNAFRLFGTEAVTYEDLISLSDVYSEHVRTNGSYNNWGALKHDPSTGFPSLSLTPLQRAQDLFTFSNLPSSDNKRWLTSCLVDASGAVVQVNNLATARAQMLLNSSSNVFDSNPYPAVNVSVQVPVAGTLYWYDWKLDNGTLDLNGVPFKGTTWDGFVQANVASYSVLTGQSPTYLLQHGDVAAYVAPTPSSPTLTFRFPRVPAAAMYVGNTFVHNDVRIVLVYKSF